MTDPRQPDLGQAREALQAGHYIQAEALYRQLAAQDPGEPGLHLALGRIYEQLDRIDDAIAAYGRALDLDPQIPEALDRCHRCIELAPNAPERYNHLAVLMAMAGRPDRAEACLLRAIDLEPRYAIAHNNLGLLLKSQGRFAEALDHYRRAVTIRPDYAQAQWNLALALLLTGRFEEGWSRFQWRRRADLDAIPEHQRHEPPTWDGSPFRGRRLLIRTEQGLGDNLQFVRYVPLVKRLGGTVILEAPPPLMDLFGQIPQIDRLVEAEPDGRIEADHDLVVYSMDLPAIFRTRLETIPSDHPYLYADIARAERWRVRLRGEGLRIGIAWAGSPHHANDHNRSCPVDLFASLAAVPGVRLYSLQKGHGSEQLHTLAPGIVEDLGPDLHDLMDTAAVLDCLDLAISVDTAVLHLAGAMGRPAWGLLPFVPDWRWLLDRADSPWYPSLRLFRQGGPGDWAGPFERVREALVRAAGSSPGGPRS